MSKAIYEPNGLILKQFFYRMECFEKKFSKEIMGEAHHSFCSIMDEFHESVDSIKSTHYEERDGLPSKKKPSSRIYTKTNSMVRHDLSGRGGSNDSNRSQSDSEPSPTEFERNNGYKDIG